jgi:hypothetical protein
VEVVVWNAARRLAALVMGALSVLAIAGVSDERIRPLSAATGGLALALLLVSLLPLARASRSLRAMNRLPEQPPVRRVYRENPSYEDCELAEREATRQAAVAFLLLALAGGLAVVAAAAR